jgi:predicted transposase YdaD
LFRRPKLILNCSAEGKEGKKKGRKEGRKKGRKEGKKDYMSQIL